MKKREEEGMPRSERLCRMLDVPADTLPFGYSIELQGRCLLKLRGGGKILLYTEEEIRIALPRSKKCALSVKGARLSCSSYNRGTLGIEGRIRSLSFENIQSQNTKGR